MSHMIYVIGFVNVYLLQNLLQSLFEHTDLPSGITCVCVLYSMSFYWRYCPRVPIHVFVE